MFSFEKKLLLLCLALSIGLVQPVSADGWRKDLGKKICSFVPSTKTGKIILGTAVVLTVATLMQLLPEAASAASAEEMCGSLHLETAGDMCACPLASATVSENFMSILGKIGENLMAAGQAAIDNNESLSLRTRDDFWEGSQIASFAYHEEVRGWLGVASDTMAGICSIASKYTHGALSQFVACMDPQRALEAVKMVGESGFNITTVSAKNYIDYCRLVWDAYQELPQ